jgi:hypothetical protein
MATLPDISSGFCIQVLRDLARGVGEGLGRRVERRVERRVTEGL